MIRDSSWRRASMLWSALTCIAALIPAALLGAWLVRDRLSTLQPVGAVLLGTAVSASGAALLLRRSWWPYRVSLLISATALLALVWLGGLFLGVYFLPAALCAMFAFGTEAFTRRAT